MLHMPILWPYEVVISCGHCPLIVTIKILPGYAVIVYMYVGDHMPCCCCLGGKEAISDGGDPSGTAQGRRGQSSGKQTQL